MTLSKTKNAIIPILFFSLWIGLAGCKSVNTTQKSINVPEDQTVLTPQKLPRKAIRLSGEVITDVALINNRKMFNLRVSAVEGIGSNFRTKEPEAGETVSINSPSDIAFEKGEVVLVDVAATKNQTGDNLMFNLLRKVVK
ncbi:hypothetical protein BFP97_11500 [Roseivirga sp. 4D4]|uniref:hypothetical protein n=1 Tax=Roseivirga sp. 4D4 TaxID=1889784 RepID=UPI000852BAFC|nr:hypothetical protein [Roseivirga sp. 4D4]OEK02108.1 hypothetical protein BFP97_11500 [Roseivirga sp. 4D4]